jgi:hypothetical protein
MGPLVKRLLPFLIGVGLGGAAVCTVFVLLIHRTPATPELRPPTAISVTLYPWERISGTDRLPVDIHIPSDQMDFAFRLLTPEAYFGEVNEFITRIVAEAVITHADGTRTHVLIRDHGHNPAVVTVDGKNYFYARNDPDVVAGAYQLIRLVNEVAHRQKGNAVREP